MFLFVECRHQRNIKISLPSGLFQHTSALLSFLLFVPTSCFVEPWNGNCVRNPPTFPRTVPHYPGFSRNIIRNSTCIDSIDPVRVPVLFPSFDFGPLREQGKIERCHQDICSLDSVDSYLPLFCTNLFR